MPRTYKPDAPAAVGIMRTRLGELLEEHAGSAAAPAIDFRTTIERVDQGEGGVTVHLSGGDTDQCDLLVAADGAYSKTRLQHFGEHLRPTYCGMGGWRYTIPRPDNLNGLVLYRSPDGHIVGGLPLSKDECYLFYLENTAEHVRMPPDRLGEMLRERLAPFGAAGDPGGDRAHRRPPAHQLPPLRHHPRPRPRGTGGGSSCSATPRTRSRRS